MSDISDWIEIEGPRLPMCQVCGKNMGRVVRFRRSILAHPDHEFGTACDTFAVCGTCMDSAWSLLEAAEPREPQPETGTYSHTAAVRTTTNFVTNQTIPTSIWWGGKWREVILMRDEEKP